MMKFRSVSHTVTHPHDDRSRRLFIFEIQMKIFLLNPERFSIPPLKNFDALKSSLRDRRRNPYGLSDYSEETWSFYMTHRFNFGFYSHVNNDQRCLTCENKSMALRRQASFCWVSVYHFWCSICADQCLYVDIKTLN